MVLKHATQSTDKKIGLRKQKIVDMNREIVQLRKLVEKRLHTTEESFNEGFAMALILLCRQYAPLHEHAFAIFAEAGYEMSDFTHLKLNPEDRKTLLKIFSI